MSPVEPVPSLEVRVQPTMELDEPGVERLLALFRATYRAANDAYLRRSLGKLRFVATAWAGETLAGFALGEMRTMDLPRLSNQAVALAGICCVDPGFRRRGLFGELERQAFLAAGRPATPRILSCGRVAHPASFRTITWNPTHVPKRGVPPTAWQRQVGAAIAEAYGAPGFDPETFVCAGAGTPIGYPVMEMEVAPEEWQAFAHVNRDRGDSLLGLAWTPDAPDGW